MGGSEGAVGDCRQLLGKVMLDSGEFGAISDPGGKEARSVYRIVFSTMRQGVAVTLLHVKPMTGRMHQIRAHLASVGRPIFSDAMYNTASGKTDVSCCPRVFLHCRRVALRDIDGSLFSAASTLSDDLVQFFEH